MRKGPDPMVAPAYDIHGSEIQGLIQSIRSGFRVTSRVIYPELALCLGGADCLESDLMALTELVPRWPGLVIACNDAGVIWPHRLDHWVTLHPEKLHERWADGLGDWIMDRARLDHPGGFLTWSRRPPGLSEEVKAKARHPLVDRIVEPWGGGSSGHFMPRVHWELSEGLPFRKTVLCGVPMTDTPHFTQIKSGGDWIYADAHWRSWERWMYKTKGWVRSMSGRSAEVLGRPTEGWIKGECDEQG